MGALFERLDAGSEPWMELGVCYQVGGDLFFQDKGDSANKAENAGSTQQAKKICASCEVSTQCLDYALAGDELYGVFGGTTPMERRRLKRERNFEPTRKRRAEMPEPRTCPTCGRVTHSTGGGHAQHVRFCKVDEAAS